MSKPRPLVIAHRGACGYLPEHTLAAKAVAHAMGADFLEQDVVLTKDAIPIVLHDIVLEHTTDVADKFPSRQSDDGHFYAMDFSLAEVKQLAVNERLTAHGDKASAAFPRRFPAEPALFTVPTLAEEVDLVQGLNKSFGRTAGLYIELKSPNRHKARGLDPVAAVAQVLRDKGLFDASDQVFIQCFDDKTLLRFKNELDSTLPRIQLIGDNSWNEDSAVDYNFLRTDEGLDYVASYAQGIGPWLSHIYLGRDDQGSVLIDNLIARAQKRKLLVHPYTFRADSLPGGMQDFNALLDLFTRELSVDGLFTDFPDKVIEFLR